MKLFRKFGLVAGLALTAIHAHAAIISSGTVNIPVSATFNGTWIDFVTGTVQQDTGDGSTGWDLNIWVTGGSWRLFVNGNGGLSDNDNGITSAILSGTLINSSNTFNTGPSNVPTLGTNYYGLRILNEATNSFLYGWVRLTLGTGPLTGTIVDYAYEDSGAGIQAGAVGVRASEVPEPSTFALVGTGLVALLWYRRRE